MNLSNWTIILASLCLTSNAWAQKNEMKDPKTGLTYLTTPTENNPFPDSIRVEFSDEKSLIIFQFRDLSKSLSRFESFAVELKRWSGQIATAIANPEAPHHVRILVNEKGETEMTIEETQGKTITLRTDVHAITELLPPGWDIEVISKGDRIHVYAPDLESLATMASENFEMVRLHYVGLVRQHSLGRQSLSSRLVITNHAIVYNSTQRKIAGDFIDFTVGGGLGLVGNRFYPLLDANLSLRFGNRYHNNNQKISLLYQYLFLAQKRSDGGFSTSGNSFLSVAWSKNLSVTSPTPQWLGLGAGLLVHRQGDYFVGRTGKFFVTETLGHFTFAQEVYLTNGYKDLLAGVRLSFAF